MRLWSRRGQRSPKDRSGEGRIHADEARARRGHEENVGRAPAETAAVIAKKKKIEDVRRRLDALFGMDAEPQKRGKLLEGVLNDLFRAFNIHAKEDFKRIDSVDGAVVEQIDGVIEFDNQVYLVEVKWLKSPVGVNDLAPHMVRLTAVPMHAASSSQAPSSAPAVSECRSHLSNKTMILSSVKEFVMILMSERDLLDMLRQKVHAALIDKQPFHEVLF